MTASTINNKQFHNHITDIQNKLFNFTSRVLKLKLSNLYKTKSTKLYESIENINIWKHLWQRNKPNSSIFLTNHECRKIKGLPYFRLTADLQQPV